jgi:AraC-like DNA-binding protein
VLDDADHVAAGVTDGGEQPGGPVGRGRRDNLAAVRLQRVVRAVDTTAHVNWAAIAARYGYCDQAHLVDDFRDLAGSTPGEYLRLRAGSPNHVRLPTG